MKPNINALAKQIKQIESGELRYENSVFAAAEAKARAAGATNEEIEALDTLPVEQVCSLGAPGCLTIKAAQERGVRVKIARAYLAALRA